MNRTASGPSTVTSARGSRDGGPAGRAGPQRGGIAQASRIYFDKNPEELTDAESALLAGELEPTNKAYALAKIAGIIMCQSYNKQYGTNFISVMPTNLFGPNDNYHPENAHVLPALIRRFHVDFGSFGNLPIRHLRRIVIHITSKEDINGKKVRLTL
jgi:nucleoside-diphosphate-sugar epimerase